MTKNYDFRRSDELAAEPEAVPSVEPLQAPSALAVEPQNAPFVTIKVVASISVPKAFLLDLEGNIGLVRSHINDVAQSFGGTVVSVDIS